MKYIATNKSLDQTKADASIVLVLKKDLSKLEDKKILKDMNFKGSNEDGILISGSSNVYVGCESLDLEDIRQAAGLAYSILKPTKFKSAKVGIYINKCHYLDIRAFVEGFELSSYQFERYKSKKNPPSLKTLYICNEDQDGKNIDIKTIKKAAQDAQIIAQATNTTKDIINTPPQDFTPIQMAKEAKRLTRLRNVTCKVFNEKFLQKEKMEAFLAVNRASIHPPRLIHLTYKPKDAKKRIIYVGKGLTYDSGGLSLKPGTSMVTMKADKSGGAAVLGIIEAAAKMELPFEIHGIIGATENMIGGNAYKPDDVLISRSGKSIEVRNTDAEGRLVLCDCLDYAQDFKPDYLIDMATLTGACVVALGEYTSGILGMDESLQQKFYNSSKRSGELTSPLYSNRHLDKALKSEIADVCNISNTRYGGAITAGIFLSRFIKKENKNKWLHLDIAGPAFIEKPWGYNQSGASGAGVRMNITWLEDLAREEA
ncbi:MAG: leucyl aminopeptidase [Proteobacteria bacterium]|nr:MAG: leucyl aminopeptidase [Pseudomonadota bacterium]